MRIKDIVPQRMELIKANKATKQLIGNIIQNFEQRSPQINHLEYCCKVNQPGEFFEMTTGKDNGILKNVTYLHFHRFNKNEDIALIVGNKSGRIVSSNNMFLSHKEILKKIKHFLTILQPENVMNSKEIEFETNAYPSMIQSSIKTKINSSEIEETIGGSTKKTLVFEPLPFHKLLWFKNLNIEILFLLYL